MGARGGSRFCFPRPLRQLFWRSTTTAKVLDRSHIRIRGWVCESWITALPRLAAAWSFAPESKAGPAWCARYRQTVVEAPPRVDGHARLKAAATQDGFHRG